MALGSDHAVIFTKWQHPAMGQLCCVQHHLFDYSMNSMPLYLTSVNPPIANN